MRSSSQATFDQLADAWDALLAERDGGERECAQELFSVARVIRNNPALGRALADPARASADRSRLALGVFGHNVSSPVSDLLSGIARARWVSAAELAEAIDEMGVRSVMAGAGRAGTLRRVEDELYRARRLLRDERELRTALGDRSRTPDDRAQLARTIFTGLGPDTEVLLDQAVRLAPRVPITQSLSAMTQAAADRAHRLVASVTVAVPLSEDQQERLTRLLNERYGGPINVHVHVDSRVIGGVRVRVGEDVIDGTLAHRVKQLREAFE